jgi:hypothetical protein
VTHFHDVSICWGCHKFARYSTPIPCILIASARCAFCRSYQLLGWDADGSCQTCYGLHMGHGDPLLSVWDPD